MWYGNALLALTGLAKLKVETKMKTITASVKTVPAGNNSSTAKIASGAKTIELLSMIRPGTDTVRGKWVRTADGVQCESSNYNRIQIPYHPPAEYHFNAQLTSQRVNSDIGIILVAHGSQIELVLGGWDNTLCGLIVGAKVNVIETMGYSIAEFAPGISSHNNEERPIKKIPAVGESFFAL